ncbi:MAG: csm2 protein [Osedax symbiont Rs1]|nr:MAG: csm2 protein [Osedax symbiont Rs1]
MGSENLFHKRKAKISTDLERRKAKRATYQKVLIVCEGEKTEPNYFKELVAYYQLNTANVEIDGSCGSSPKNVLIKALELYSIEENRGDPFDRVYCVFDKDTHSTFGDTVTTINNHKPRDIFFHASSVPCFEFWLILHFNPTTKPYEPTGKNSAADLVIRDLKQYIPGYKKGDAGIFKQLHPQTEFAKANAIRVNRQAKQSNTDNPSTHIIDLIHYLQNLKSQI